MADTLKCEDCGGTEFIGAGSRLDKQGKWHMIQCTACGHKQKDKLIMQFKKKDLKKTRKISELALTTRDL
uniref:Uncharacterized protein n=1 Tax=viral metagenome TaxID=1070528 RepID=A0A6M3M1F6_9ZZZZ